MQRIEYIEKPFMEYSSASRLSVVAKGKQKRHHDNTGLEKCCGYTCGKQHGKKYLAHCHY